MLAFFAIIKLEVAIWYIGQIMAWTFWDALSPKPFRAQRRYAQRR